MANGTSLSHASPGAQGVLPSPGGGDMSPNMSASAMYADGGDVGQDSGNAAAPNSDPFSLISEALSYGRKKAGLPESFFGDSIQRPAKPKPSNDPASTASAVDEEGGNGTDQDGRAMSLNGAANDLQPGEQVGEGAGAVGYQPKTQWLAEGGEVQDDSGQQGMIPDDTQSGDDDTQTGSIPEGQQQQSGQGAMGYLTGQGGVGPEVAAALERQVDPQGTMDPNMRKMLAVQATGSPDKAFGLLQHYRQKFNAYNAFAKAAANGSGGRPPDLRASAEAASQAYQHLPDGKAIDFQPVQGGMRVIVRDAMPPGQHFDTSGKPVLGQPQTKRIGWPDKQQYAEGGAVDDTGNDPMIPEQQDMSDSGGGPMPQQSAGPAPQGDKVKDALGGKAPHEALRDFVLSVPQYLGWLANAGQADSVLDKGAEATLAEAAKQQQGPQDQQQMPSPQDPFNPMQTGPGMQQRPGVTSQRPQNPGVQNMNANPMTGGQQPPIRQTPKNAEKFGSEVGTKGGEAGATLTDVLHEIDQAYPSVGMSRERSLARAAARQHWADNRVKVEAEQTRSTRAENVAHIAGGSRQAVAATNANARTTAVGMQQEGAGQRNENTNTARRDIATQREGGVEKRFQQGEQGRNDRSIMMNKPGVIGNAKKMEEARGSIAQPGAQRPPQQGQGGEQMKLVNGKWYKRGPNGEAVEVQGPAQ